MKINMAKVISNQANKADQATKFQITDGTTDKTTLQLNGNNIQLKVNNQNVLTAKNGGTELDQNVIVKGGVMRQKNSYMQMENPAKELYIPSSTVTPLPDKFPWLEFLQQFTFIADAIMKFLDKTGGN